jgi:crossover junction endodeoxyribonuclease RuvC
MRSKESTPVSRIILAIDPGFDRLGIAVLTLEGNKEILLYSDCIRTNVKETRDKRLQTIGLGIKEVIKKWKPKELAIETLYFNANTSSAIGVAEARGVAVYEAAVSGLEVFEYSPQAIKVAVTGYGKANKSQIGTMVKQLIKLPFKPKSRLDDEIDAVALGITHLVTRRYPHKGMVGFAK